MHFAKCTAEGGVSIFGKVRLADKLLRARTNILKAFSGAIKSRRGPQRLEQQ